MNPNAPAKDVCMPMEGEGPKPFAAFVTFLAQGDTRCYASVSKALGVSQALIARWGSKWRWQERLNAWNAQMIDMQRQQMQIVAASRAVDWAKRAGELREKEWEITQKALALVSKLMDRLLKRMRGRATIQDTARLLEIASKVGRLSTGLATERGELSGVDGEPIKVDLEIALKKVYGASDPSNHSVIPLLPENSSEGQLRVNAGQSGTGCETVTIPEKATGEIEGS